jgi:acyl-coenzyme A thioesterase PaaI-like protein
MTVTVDAHEARGAAHERLAAATRRLVDAVLATHATNTALSTAAAATEEIVGRLERATSVDAGAPLERTHDDYLPRSPFVGAISPVAPPFSYEWTTDAVIARGAFGTPHQGPPGYVHGGWVALAFDELLGMANSASGHPGMTGRLTVRYRRPTPLHTEVTFEARTARVDGRRIMTVGTLHTGDAITAEAEGLFVVLGAERALEYFGERPASPEPTDPLP